MPAVCTDICVERIRYTGILLYDMGAVLDAAKISDEKNIYPRLLDIIKDPTDPVFKTAARE